MQALSDWVHAVGPWAAAGLFLGLVLLWAVIVWAIDYWLRRMGLHKGRVIAQVRVVWFLGGVALLVDLIFLPALPMLIGTLMGVLLVLTVQTVIYLIRNTDSGDRGATGDDWVDNASTRDRDNPF